MALSGGQLEDTAGNTANLSLALPGETNSLSDDQAIEIDTIAPSVSFNSLSIINLSNVSVYNISGSCSEEGQDVDYVIGTLNGTVVCSSSAWSVTLNASSIPDNASVAITADHSDVAGNAATQASTSVLKDTVRPSPLALTRPTSRILLGSASQTLDGTCETGATVSISGDLVSSASGVCASGNYSIAVSLSSGDGLKNITIDQTDPAGNSMSPALSANFTLDTAVPTISIDSSPIINIANVASYTFSGSCSEDGQDVDYVIGTLNGTVVCSSSAWSVTLNASTIGDSSAVAITADHSDVAGNAATQATTSVLKDTVRPSPLALTSPTSGSYLGSASQTLDGTCETGATVSISGDLVSSASGVCSSGNYSIAINLTSGDGLKNITIDQTDPAGNSMSPALSANFTLDTAVPTISIDSTPIINIANVASYTFSGSCSEEGQDVDYVIGTLNGTVVCSSSAWSVTLNASTIPENASVAITADHSDVAGNAATQACTSVLKDTVRPSPLALTSPTSGSYLGSASQTLDGTCEDGSDRFYQRGSCELRKRSMRFRKLLNCCESNKWRRPKKYHN